MTVFEKQFTLHIVKVSNEIQIFRKAFDF